MITLILFILGVSITLDLIFGLIIYIFLIKDMSFKSKKKDELDISKLELKEKVDSNFWS